MKAVIALGANLEDPETAVELAISLLELSTDLISRSKLYSTKPVGGPQQPDYVNAVAIIDEKRGGFTNGIIFLEHLDLAHTY